MRSIMVSPDERVVLDHPVEMPGVCIFSGRVDVAVGRVFERTVKRLTAETVFALLDIPIK